MKKGKPVERYALIIRKVRKGPCSFNDIQDYLEQESQIQGLDFTVSKRTFLRDKEEILRLYNVDIQCDKPTNIYYIDKNEDNPMNERILEAFDTFNALNVTERISKHIYFEKRIASGTEHLQPLLKAIRDEVHVEYIYTKFYEDEGKKRIVKPLGLKEFKYRWYLISLDTKDERIKTFGLDRITELSVTRLPFKRPKDFDMAKHFENCFGIIGSNAEAPSNIELTCNGDQVEYFKTLPLHESQKITPLKNDRFKIELLLYITKDLIQELLSQGSAISVQKPKNLKRQVESGVIEV